MRRSDPLFSQFSIISIVLMIGVKAFVILLTIVIGGFSFLQTQSTYLSNLTLTPPSERSDLINNALPTIMPDIEWSKPLSTMASSDAQALTPAPNSLPTQEAVLPTPFVQNTPLSSDQPSAPLLVSSPLMGISLEELPSTISQEFRAPPTGEDTGHHGVDFAFWSRGNQSSILGLPITSVFSGKVISAFNEIRLPYGYLTVVETPLSTLPQSLLSAIKLPEMAAATGINDKLNCPTGYNDQWNNEAQSLYVLYAHMNKPPVVVPGQMVNAGDVIGEVGNTGASSAPHLHLEMRIGPSNAAFESIGHYDVATTEQERHNYCVWRVSGVFQMFNPTTLLTVQ